MKSSNSKGSNSSFSVVPPSNFSYFEESIVRCTYPITRHNLSFLQSTAVNYVINISGRRLDQAVLTALEEKNIEVKLLLQEGEMPPFSPLSAHEGWIASSIELLLSKSSEGTVLVMGGVDSYLDCLLLACLRRLQEWSYVSILAEFRHHTWPHKLHDFEQVIEKFDPMLVEWPSNVPEFLSIHDNFKEEEHKLLCKPSLLTPTMRNTPTSEFTAGLSYIPDSPMPPAHSTLDSSEGHSSFTFESVESHENPGAPSATAAAISSTSDAGLSNKSAALEDEQSRIDAILKKLFFSPKNQLISEGTVFDAAISLINEKDEED